MGDIDERVAIEVRGWRIDSYRLNCFCNAEDAYYSNDPPNMWEFKIRKSEWQPSKRIDQTWMVVEKMREDGYEFNLEAMDEGFFCMFGTDLENGVIGIDAPMVICQAALKVKEK